MKHCMIAISPGAPWSTLDELLGPPQALGLGVPEAYLARERAFVDVGRRFLDVVGGGRAFEYRDLNVFDDYPLVLDPGRHPAVYEHIDAGIDEIARALGRPFCALSPRERALVFQLAARDLLAMSIVADDGVTLSTMDDGFYWFVSLPDDVDPAAVAGDEGVIFESIDIFDPA